MVYICKFILLNYCIIYYMLYVTFPKDWSYSKDILILIKVALLFWTSWVVPCKFRGANLFVNWITHRACKCSLILFTKIDGCFHNKLPCIVFRIPWKMGFWQYKQSATISWHLLFLLQQQSHWVHLLAFLLAMTQKPN